MELRDYQMEAVEAITSTEKGRSTLIALATGAGKTVIMAFAIKELVEQGFKCLLLAHRGELIKQATVTLERVVSCEIGVFSAYCKRKEIKQLTIASIQSFHKRHKRNEIPNGEFDFVFVDEAHRLKDKNKESQYRDVIEDLGASLIGVTATPYRITGNIYGDEFSWFDEVAFSVGLRPLIDEGFLVDYKHQLAEGTKAIQKDLKKVTKQQGEYNQKELGSVCTKTIHLDTVIHAVNDYGKDRKSIVIFCVNIEHAEKMVERLIDLHEDAVLVHSKIHERTRDINLWLFNSGLVRYMINVGVLTEGWDCTRVDCVALARPTKSTALYVQMVGRGLRLDPMKKDCLVLDVVGNCVEHGLVEDPTINKEDDSDPDKKENRICEFCLMFVKNIPVCGECGEERIPEKQDYEFSNTAMDFKEVSIREIVTIHHGKCLEHTTASGNKCLKVVLNGEYYHYYRTDLHWMRSKFAKIINENSIYDVGKTLNPSRFMDAINGQHIFPIEGVSVVTENGFKKVQGF